MRYLGRMSGSGELRCNGETIVRTTYDIDGFFRSPTSVVGTGELRLPAGTQRMTGRKGVQLFTDDGRVLDLGFPGGAAQNDPVSAIDVRGGLDAAPGSWRR